MKKIGQGEDAEIFALEGRRLLKLFYPHHRDLVELEAGITQRVQQAGLPAPAVDSVVECRGRLGILFNDFTEGLTLRRKVRKQPWRLRAAARLLAELHATIHARSVAGLPLQRDELARQIQGAAALSPAIQEAAMRALNQLPAGEAVCHNDLHLNNVILAETGPVIIDWVLAAQGHPLSDVARTCLLLRLGLLPENPIAYTALSGARAWFERVYLDRYFELRPGAPQDVRAWELPVAAALAARRSNAQRRDQLLAVVAKHLRARS